MREMKTNLIAIALMLWLGIAQAAAPKAQLTVKAIPDNEVMSASGGDEPTFKTSDEAKTFWLGKLPTLKDARKDAPAKEFLQADVKLPKAFHLKDLAKKIGVELAPTFDQGQCGSCVYNSVMRNATDNLRLRKQATDVLSRQYSMCLAQWSCSGSLFENVAKALVGKQAVSEGEYPYQARDASCRDVSSMKKFGPFKGYKIIDNSPKSIMTALYQGFPVSVTVAADGTWSSYSGGIYNRSTSTSTNHEVLIYGWDCESALDADGNCDPNQVTKTVGYAVMENSWGTSWGESGAMRTRWGMNALAEEAGILDSGIPLPDPNPPGPTPPGPTPPGPTPQPFALQAWMIYAALGLLAVMIILQLLHNFSVKSALQAGNKNGTKR